MPDTDPRRDVIVAFRVTGAEAAHIDAAGAALRHPRSRADFARAVALHAARQSVPAPAKPIRRPAKRRPALDIRLLAQILAAIGKVGGHTNQLAKVANSTRALPAAEALAPIAAEVAAIRTALVAALSGADAEHGAPEEAAP